jgi:hypothetical protein
VTRGRKDHFERRLRRGDAGIFGVDLRTRDIKFFFSFVDWDSDKHADFMRKEDAEEGTDKNDQFITVEHFQLSAVILPRVGLSLTLIPGT